MVSRSLESPWSTLTQPIRLELCTIGSLSSTWLWGSASLPFHCRAVWRWWVDDPASRLGFHGGCYMLCLEFWIVMKEKKMCSSHKQNLPNLTSLGQNIILFRGEVLLLCPGVLNSGQRSSAIHNFWAKSTIVTQRSRDSFSPDLVMPLLVAMMRMGAMSPSSARFRKEKHSISSMCTSSMNSTCTQTHTKHTIVSGQRDYHTLTPGTISAFPSSLHSATFALICSRTSPFISPVSPAIDQL